MKTTRRSFGQPAVSPIESENVRDVFPPPATSPADCRRVSTPRVSWMSESTQPSESEVAAAPTRMPASSAPALNPSSS